MAELHDVLISDPLIIKYAPGRSRKLVVSFSGVGTKRSEAPPPEFYSIAGNQGENHVLFVTDMSRSWLNAPLMAEKIVKVIEWLKTRIDAERVMAVGNSMGGTAALLLSNHTHFDTVTAVVPQVSINPDIVPEEQRWTYFRDQIETFRFDKVASMAAADTQYFVLHGDTPDELIHALRFPKIENGAHVILHGHDHNLARRLRKEGHLPGLMFHMMEGHKRRVVKRLAKFGGVEIDGFKSSRGKEILAKVA